MGFWDRLLDQCPNGIFVALAEIRLKKLQEQEVETEIETPPEIPIHGIVIRDHEKCTSQTPSGVECWQEIQNQPGCYVFVVEYDAVKDKTLPTWDGQCLDNIVHGRGTITWTSFAIRATGTFIHGQPDGHWVVHHYRDGLKLGAIYRDGGKLWKSWVIEAK